MPGAHTVKPDDFSRALISIEASLYQVINSGPLAAIEKINRQLPVINEVVVVGYGTRMRSDRGVRIR